MTDIPIIFSAPMVRALLDGRKTMTRRLLRHPVPEAPAMDAVHSANLPRHAAPYLDAYCSERPSPLNPRGMGRNWCWWTRDDRACQQFRVGYIPGDRLWVRENYRTAAKLDACSMKEIARQAWDAGYRRPWCPIRYEADGVNDNWTATDWGEFGKQRPCIFMPRWASRLTLIVTGVKIERLQGISEADARAEGMDLLRSGRGYYDPRFGHGAVHLGYCDSACHAFRTLWNHLHGAEAWDADPHVVALTFTVHKTNIDALPKMVAA
jgi:hypothetical protein